MIFGNFGIWQLVLVLLVIVILFGVGKLPEVGRGMGRAIREFRTNVATDEDAKDKAANNSSSNASADGSGEAGNTNKSEAKSDKDEA